MTFCWASLPAVILRKTRQQTNAIGQIKILYCGPYLVNIPTSGDSTHLKKEDYFNVWG